MILRESRAEYHTMQSKRKKSLTVRIEHGLIEAGLLKCTGNAVKAYGIIRMHANYTTRKAYPTFATIRKYTTISKDERVKKAIVELRDKGFLEYEYRKLRNKEGEAMGRKRYVYYVYTVEEVFQNQQKIAKLEGAFEGG